MNPGRPNEWLLILVVAIAIFVVSVAWAWRAARAAERRHAPRRMPLFARLAIVIAIAFAVGWSAVRVEHDRSSIASVGLVRGAPTSNVPDRLHCVVALTDAQMIRSPVPVHECVVELARIMDEPHSFSVAAGLGCSVRMLGGAVDLDHVQVTMRSFGLMSFSMSMGNGTTWRTFDVGDGGLPFGMQAGQIEVGSLWVPLTTEDLEARVFLRLLRPGERLEPAAASAWSTAVGRSLREAARADAADSSSFLREPQPTPHDAAARLAESLDFQGSALLFCGLWCLLHRRGAGLSAAALALVATFCIGGTILHLRHAAWRVQVASVESDPTRAIEAAAAMGGSVVFPERNGAALLDAYAKAADPATRFDLVHAAGRGNDALRTSPAVLDLLMRAAQDVDPAVRALAARSTGAR
ncbi:MAG: HEAT repeat domain-containing protein [Planctomycetes bacterium]|nr:HEAT repeat domain-containing protein [Planctomycetota bacterium]MCC7169057.1 HEAT repeat domain-containing protein [Planctomycetota bacterium]